MRLLQSLTNLGAAFCLLILIFSQEARGWNAFVHKMVGRLVYDRLEEGQQDFLDACSSSFREVEGYPIKSFATLSVWPDQAKRLQAELSEGFKGFLDEVSAGMGEPIEGNTRDWHYVDIPYCVEVEESTERSGRLLSVLPKVLDILEKNIDEAKTLGLEACDDTLRSKIGMSLAFFVHLFTDLHCPAHCTNLFSENFPEGDGGGSRYKVLVSAKKKKKKRNKRTGGKIKRNYESLHDIWDRMFYLRKLTGGNKKCIYEKLKEAVIQAEAEDLELTKESLEAYAQESYELGKSAYNTIPLKTLPKSRSLSFLNKKAELQITNCVLRLISILRKVL